MTIFKLPLFDVHEFYRPFLIRFAAWYRENRQAVHDLIVLFILSIFTYFVFAASDVTEVFYEFTRTHENLQIDDLILTLGMTSSIYLTIFALRRWAEAAKRLRQANTDGLTKLFNRHKGWEMMEYEIARSKRYRRPLSVIMLDVDHFKAINDRHGHLNGDRVLIGVANVLQENIRSIDILTRWGGEEFMIISPETAYEEAHETAERLRREIERAPVQRGIAITISLGVTQLEENDDFNTLFERVDGKLYEAKATGRNRVM